MTNAKPKTISSNELDIPIFCFILISAMKLTPVQWAMKKKTSIEGSIQKKPLEANHLLYLASNIDLHHEKPIHLL